MDAALFLKGESMSLESDLFAYLRPRADMLQKYGFRKEENNYVLEKELIRDEFNAVVRVDEHGHVSGSVIDCFSGEEFVPVRIAGQSGPYVSHVRDTYLSMLEEIAAACFVPVDFSEDMANKMAEWVKEAYGDVVDHPFEKDQGSGVFRRRDSRKWYGAVLHIPYEKLMAKQGETDILNVKIRPEEKEALLQKDGFFPAWHMNRTHWISILLDGTVSEDVLKERLIISRQLTEGRKNSDTEANTWLIPSNPNMWDIIGAMKRSDRLIWKQHRGVKQGDTVYIYVGAPYSAILYAYIVEEADVPSTYDFGKCYPYEMHLLCTHRFAKEQLPFAVLKECGVTAVRGPRTVTHALAERIQKECG